MLGRLRSAGPRLPRDREHFGTRRGTGGSWVRCGASNDDAVTHGDRILSVYEAAGGVRFWLITEADRSATTALLPDEY